MIVSKGPKSYTKKEFSQSFNKNTAYDLSLRFAHICAGGEAEIDLTSVTAPIEMSANGFANPNTAAILSANIFFNRKAVTVFSSKRGALIQDLAYKIVSNSKIRLIGFTADADEIFDIQVKFVQTSSSVSVVNGQQTVNTGTLDIGQTDFAVDPFEYMKFPTKQVGAVIVFRNGKQQYRCENNDITNDGDFIEVNNGAGLCNLIRFKTAAGVVDSVTVLSNGPLVERPDGSMMAVIQTLAGQIDKIVPAMSQVTGRPVTDYQTAPNDVDLATFGNQVVDHESRVTLLEGVHGSASAMSDELTPSGSSQWHTMTNNSITLTPGIWMITGEGRFWNSGSSPAYTETVAGVYGANGANLGTAPTPLGSVPGVVLLSKHASGGHLGIWSPPTAANVVPMPVFFVKILSPVTVYGLAYSASSTPANARIRTSINALRVGNI